MKNKVAESLRWYFEKLEEEQTRNRLDDFNKQLEELNDLIYRMWKNDLISDKVEKECFEVTKEYFSKSIKYQVI